MTVALLGGVIACLAFVAGVCLGLADRIATRSPAARAAWAYTATAVACLGLGLAAAALVLAA